MLGMLKGYNLAKGDLDPELDMADLVRLNNDGQVCEIGGQTQCLGEGVAGRAPCLKRRNASSLRLSLPLEVDFLASLLPGHPSALLENAAREYEARARRKGGGGRCSATVTDTPEPLQRRER